MKEKNLSEQDNEDNEILVLRLYVAGTRLLSARAIQNLKNILEEKLKGRYHLEIIDVYQQPDLVAREDIFAVPMLIKKEPLPVRFLIGDMSDSDRVIRGLGL